MDFHTTDPQIASPFASTVYDPRDLQKKVAATMARARKHRMKIPEPGTFWEEPGHHGSGRQVSLRKARSIPLYTAAELKARVRESLRLPPIPQPKGLSGGTIALVAVGAIGTGVLIGVLWNRRKRALAGSPSRTSVSGYDLLGCTP